VGVYPGLTEEMLAWIAQSIRDLVRARRMLSFRAEARGAGGEESQSSR